MILGWLDSIIYSILSGISEFLPISGQALRTVIVYLYGHSSDTALLRFLAHLGCFVALMICSWERFRLILRERVLLNTPKRRRARRPDMQKIHEWKLLCCAFPWLLIGCFLYLKVGILGNDLGMLAFQVFVFALILCIPTRMAQGDKDSRNMSIIDCFAIGIGGCISVIPGFSTVGMLFVCALATGLSYEYAYDFAMMLLIPFMGMISLLDLAMVFSEGAVIGGGTGFLRCLLGLLLSTGTGYLSLQILKRIAIKSDIRSFIYYNLGLALFIFMIYIMV